MKKTISIKFPNDKILEQLNDKEEQKQFDYINLIASENYVSPAVRIAQTSVLGNKYAEGYPGARYYAGSDEAVDPVELLTQERALKVMRLSSKKWGVNAQPYSGSNANLEVLGALVKSKGETDKKETVLGMALSSGGHLTHGHKVSFSGKFFNFVQYEVDENGLLDYGEIEKLAAKYRPRLIICGATAYSRIINFKRFSQIAKKYNALLMADISHIAGLIAGGVHPSPFLFCDVATSTTHKTLRGPRGALIFARKEFMPTVNKAVFPGMQGTPHENEIFSLAVALGEALNPSFKQYAKQIVRKAKVLAKELQKNGFDISAGGTDNHLMLVDLRNKDITGTQAQNTLYQAGIITNRNAIPHDPNPPFNPSGIRIGTPASTTRGFKEKEMIFIAEWMTDALANPDAKHLSQIKKAVQTLCKKFPPPGF